MAKRNVFSGDTMDYPVTLIKYSDKEYKVLYGEQVIRCWSYSEAAAKLGACIMHSLQCAGNLD